MVFREKYHGHSDWFKKRNWVGEAKQICELVGIKYDSS